MTTASKPRILVVEDDEATAELERRTLSRAGYPVLVVGRVADALRAIESDPGLGAVLLDYQLPDGDPWPVLDAALARETRLPVVLVTAMTSDGVAVEAIHHGVADYVKKSIDFYEGLPRLIERVTRLSVAEELLRRERARLEEAQRIAQIGSWEWDVTTNIVMWSDELYRIYGRDKTSFGASYEAFLECVHPEDRASVAEVIGRAYQTGESFRNVYRIAGVESGERYVEGRGHVTLAGGKVVRMTGTAQDVTEREAQQARLRESDAFFELSLDMLSTASVDGYFRRVSPAFRVLGYTEHELTTTPFVDLIHPDDIPATMAEVAKLKLGIKTIHFENRYRCKDGSYRWIAWSSSPAPNGILYGTGRDITEQKRAAEERETLNQQLKSLNASLTHSLREREVLLQEIHHRVKNNLQVISSLINLQVRKLDAGENRDALEECRRRVMAIALIHEKLYQSGDFARIPFEEYARSLATSVFHASAGTSRVRLVLEVEAISLAVDQAIPCGLVLNELITNALKHGYSDGRAGTVRVELDQDGGRVRLAVMNDGIDLPANFREKATSSLGLHLVDTLASQLGGELAIRSAPSTSFQLSFPAAS